MEQQDLHRLEQSLPKLFISYQGKNKGFTVYRPSRHLLKQPGSQGQHSSSNKHVSTSDPPVPRAQRDTESQLQSSLPKCDLSTNLETTAKKPKTGMFYKTTDQYSGNTKVTKDTELSAGCGVHTPAIPALGKLRQEDFPFEAILD